MCQSETSSEWLESCNMGIFDTVGVLVDIVGQNDARADIRSGYSGSSVRKRSVFHLL